MKKRYQWLVFSLLIICLLLPSDTVSETIETWRCDLDLHQGDQGYLEFQRTANNIRGKTVVHRGTNRFDHSINGTWRGDNIQFRRELSGNSSQHFRGVAMTVEGNEVKMGGRFAYKYAGIWSADCKLVRQTSQPKTFSTGQLDIPQTWTVDLDGGKVGERDEADIWFQAETARRRYITPRNGAKIGIAGTRSVGRDGCAALSLSTSRIPLRMLPEGTYVCVLTNRGRYSQFRVNALTGRPGVLKIGYTTWARSR